MHLMISDIEHGYRTALREILRYGNGVSPRGVKTRELENVTLQVIDPSDVLLLGTGRKMSPRLAALEALQLVGGFSDPGLVVHVAPQYAQFMDGNTFHGAYGLRTGRQVALAAQRLRDDPSTRRSLITFWNPALDLAREGLHDYPCTISATFHVRNGTLDMSTVMRSNDVWLGFPYDVVQFTSLQRALASFLDVPVGTYTHTAQSMHAYVSDLDAIRVMADGNNATTMRTRTQLRGGIGSMYSPIDIMPGDDAWSGVQKRAIMICYAPETTIPENAEEEWMITQALSWAPWLDETRASRHHGVARA